MSAIAAKGQLMSVSCDSSKRSVNECLKEGLELWSVFKKGLFHKFRPKLSNQCPNNIRFARIYSKWRV